jgi:alkylation response protein AidB-like acyl-CoA dehydrogenase
MYLQETDEQQALRTELRAYFAELLSPEVRADIGYRGEGGEGWRRIVKQMGTDGWLGIGWPKEFGGQGRPATDQFIFYDEVQRAKAPVPFVTLNTVGPTLMRYGSDEQKATLLPQIVAGTLRPIAVLSETRMKQLANVPTSVEQGFKKYVGSSWSSIVVPAKTPQAIIDKINADIAAVIKDPGFRDKLEEQGAQFLSVNAKDAQDFLVKESKLWAPMVEASGIEPPNN